MRLRYSPESSRFESSTSPLVILHFWLQCSLCRSDFLVAGDGHGRSSDMPDRGHLIAWQQRSSRLMRGKTFLTIFDLAVFLALAILMLEQDGNMD